MSLHDKAILYSLEIRTTNPSARTNNIYRSSLFSWTDWRRGLGVYRDALCFQNSFGYKIENSCIKQTKRGHPYDPPPYPLVKANLIWTFVHDKNIALSIVPFLTLQCKHFLLKMGFFFSIFFFFKFRNESELNFSSFVHLLSHDFLVRINLTSTSFP